MSELAPASRRLAFDVANIELKGSPNKAKQIID